MKTTLIVLRGFGIGIPFAAAASANPSESTMNNLQAAFNGESNAHARYLAFAENADAEG